jgi:hypothetical protein
MPSKLPRPIPVFTATIAAAVLVALAAPISLVAARKCHLRLSGRSFPYSRRFVPQRWRFTGLPPLLVA